MRRKFLCLILFIMLALLTACKTEDVTKYNYTFTGENENWEANLKVTGKTAFTKTDGILKAESESSEVLTVTYKGELSEISSVKHMEISYKTNAGGSKQVTNYDENEAITNKTFILKSSSKNGALINEDEIIEVTINFDGNTQITELKSSSKK